MSQVTNVILSFSVSEGYTDDDRDVIAEVNKFFIGDKQQFVVPSNHDWYGGAKCLERPTFVGAFNYLDIEGLIYHLKNMKWQYPENVQLFICDQEDEEYHLIYPCRRTNG